MSPTTSDAHRWPYERSDLHGYLHRSLAARDVLAEAMRHYDHLGYSPDHDDEHDTGAWAHLIGLRLARLLTPSNWKTAPAPAQVREYLAEIAAMAIRAIEAHDRRVE